MTGTGDNTKVRAWPTLVRSGVPGGLPNSYTATALATSGNAKFKEICLANYKNLAFHYARRASAGEFLARFCDKEGKSYLPKHAQARAFVEHYYARYKAIGNELDESGEWEKWQASER